MLDTHSPNLTDSIRTLLRDSDAKHHRATASQALRTRRPHRNRQRRERRTFYAMFGFGLLLGGLELFIVLHYL